MIFEPVLSEDIYEFNNVSHTQQVRYSIRRHKYCDDKGKEKIGFYIVDNVRVESPSWSKGVFYQYHQAVKRLQAYIRNLGLDELDSMVFEWRKSSLTFTRRNKNELKIPD